MTSHARLTGSRQHRELLRDQVESLSAEIEASPHGLLEDYPGERAHTSASLVNVPGDPPELWEARDVPHGKVEVNWEKSRVTGDTRAYYVYTPPGCDPSRSARYPVLYLLHGNNDTAAGWTDVGKKYRVAGGRENRAIVGLSMGGGHALQIGLSHLDRFSAVAAFSSAVPRDFETRFKSLLDNSGATNKKLKLLWIDCGRQDSAFERNQKLSELLTAHQIQNTFHPTEGRHNFALWRRYLTEVAPLLFRKDGQTR